MSPLLWGRGDNSVWTADGLTSFDACALASQTPLMGNMSGIYIICMFFTASLWCLLMTKKDKLLVGRADLGCLRETGIAQDLGRNRLLKTIPSVLSSIMWWNMLEGGYCGVVKDLKIPWVFKKRKSPPMYRRSAECPSAGDVITSLQPENAAQNQPRRQRPPSLTPSRSAVTLIPGRCAFRSRRCNIVSSRNVSSCKSATLRRPSSPSSSSSSSSSSSPLPRSLRYYCPNPWLGRRCELFGRCLHASSAQSIRGISYFTSPLILIKHA